MPGNSYVGQVAVTAGSVAITSTTNTPVGYGLKVTALSANVYYKASTTASSTNSAIVLDGSTVTINPAEFGIGSQGYPDLSTMIFVGSTTGTLYYSVVLP